MTKTITAWFRIFIVGANGILFVACGGHTNTSLDTTSSAISAPPVSAGPFNGAFLGTELGSVSGQAFSHNITVAVAQSNNTVTGNWSSANGTIFGTLSGVASGNILTNLQIQESPGSICYPASYAGSLAMSGNNLVGNISANSSACGNITSNFSLGASAQNGKTNPFLGTFNGTEVGTIAGASFSQPVKFMMSQSAGNVSGAWTSTDGSAFGTFSGVASGNYVSNLVISESSGSACFPGSYSGSFTIGGNDMVGQITGSSTPCGIVSAGITAR
jgi:hypothetical protein